MERKLRRRSACFCAHLSLISLIWSKKKKKKKATVEFAISTLPILIHFVSHFSWNFSQEKLKTTIMQNFWGANKVYYGQCGNGKETKAKKGYQVAVIALVFVSVSSSVPSVHCTGPVKPADNAHMVSGCTVAPMAYFYIVVFQIFLKSSQ